MAGNADEAGAAHEPDNAANFWDGLLRDGYEAQKAAEEAALGKVLLLLLMLPQQLP